MPDESSLEALLDREVEQLDRLLSEVRSGVRGQSHYDALEADAQGIAQRLRAAFRR